jgi:hypothetical protein
MPKHIVPHDLSIEMAKKVTEKAWETYSAKYANYNPTMRWATDTRSEVSFQAKGLTVRGSMDILPNGVAIDLEVPFILLPFKKKTIEVVEEEIREWIAKAKAGEV